MDKTTKAIGDRAEDQFEIDIRAAYSNTNIEEFRRATRNEQNQGIDFILTIKIGETSIPMFIDVKSHEHNIFGKLMLDRTLTFRNPINIDSRATHLAIWKNKNGERKWRVITRAEYMAQFFESGAKQIEFALIYTLLQEKNIDPYVREEENGILVSKYTKIMMETLKEPLNACLKPEWQVSFDQAEYDTVNNRWYNSTSCFDHIRLSFVPRKSEKVKREEEIKGIETCCQYLKEIKDKKRAAESI